jgi:23S rRNA pseudouridine1911/1915/1917 synthase
VRIGPSYLVAAAATSARAPQQGEPQAQREPPFDAAAATIAMVVEATTSTPAAPEGARAIVPTELAGQLLDAVVRQVFSAALVAKLSGRSVAPITQLSWNDARALIRQGKVFLNGAVESDPLRRVRAASELLLRMRAPKPTTREARLPDEAIVFLDNHVIVVDKPAGISTIPFDGAPAQDTEERTLDEAVRAYLSSRAPRGERSERPALGVVHRIDKETSGLLVFARTWLAKESLAGQFRAHSTHRRYLALVHGAARSMTVQSHLLADRGDGFRGSRERSSKIRHGGQLAVTHVELLERFSDSALVACVLETGRTHQIRIHLSELGWPLLGDRVYSRDYQKHQPVIPAPRLMLHARELGFTHPKTGQRLTFEREPPSDFAETLERVRVSGP